MTTVFCIFMKVIPASFSLVVRMMAVLRDNKNSPLCYNSEGLYLAAETSPVMAFHCIPL